MAKLYVGSRRPKIPILLIVFIIVLIAIIAAIFIVMQQNQQEQSVVETTDVSLYFVETSSMQLKPEKRASSAKTNVESVKLVLEELVVGPKTVTYKTAVPADVIGSAAIIGDNVEILMTQKYKTLKPDEEILCRSAIVSSLTGLPFIESVTILVEGKELTKPNGQPFGKIKASDIVISPDINPQGDSLRTIELYFADKSQTGLVKETRTISMNPNDSPAKYIVNELIKGPVSADLVATVPPETKLLDVNTQDGICYVDLSKEFVSKHPGGETAEMLTIYSIVDSLTTESDIKNVQFYIEGERQEKYKDSVDIKNIFEAKEMPPEGN